MVSGFVVFRCWCCLLVDRLVVVVVVLLFPSCCCYGALLLDCLRLCYFFIGCLL